MSATDPSMAALGGGDAGVAVELITVALIGLLAGLAFLIWWR